MLQVKQDFFFFMLKSIIIKNIIIRLSPVVPLYRVDYRWFYDHPISLNHVFQGGSAIRLFHKEMEAYMVAEGLFDDEVTEDGKFVEIHIHKFLEYLPP